MKLLSKRARLAAVLSAAAIGLATSASAATISGLSITNNSNTTGTGGGGASDRATAGGTQTISSGATAFSIRYWATTAADRGAAFSGGTATAQINVNYTISFSVTHTAGVNYQIDIGTLIRGGLTALDDAAGLSSGGSATVNNVSGSRTGGGALVGGLGLTSNASQGGTSSTSGTQTSVYTTNAATIFAVGTGSAQAYSLTFQYTVKATSPQNVAGGDEHAARFGYSAATGSILAGASADDYAGIGSRNGLNDGHFVNVTITPEPGTVLLIGLGLAGLAFGSRRRA